MAESIWQLDGPGFCFDVDLHAIPDVASLAFTEKQTLTFGSFNHTRKITPACIKRFARLLNQFPEASLLLRSHSFYDLQVRRYFLRALINAGSDPAQIQALPYAPSADEALRDYGKIHIHLDSYPVCGTTTTLDALAMGTPVLTTPTHLYAGAISAAILTQLGYSHWICESIEDMSSRIESTFATYCNPQQRKALAAKVRASPLFDTLNTPISFSQSLRRMIKSTPS